MTETSSHKRRGEQCSHESYDSPQAYNLWCIADVFSPFQSLIDRSRPGSNPIIQEAAFSQDKTELANVETLLSMYRNEVRFTTQILACSHWAESSSHCRLSLLVFEFDCKFGTAKPSAVDVHFSITKNGASRDLPQSGPMIVDSAIYPASPTSGETGQNESEYGNLDLGQGLLLGLFAGKLPSEVRDFENGHLNPQTACKNLYHSFTPHQLPNSAYLAPMRFLLAIIIQRPNDDPFSATLSPMLIVRVEEISRPFVAFLLSNQALHSNMLNVDPRSNGTDISIRRYDDSFGSRRAWLQDLLETMGTRTRHAQTSAGKFSSEDLSIEAENTADPEGTATGYLSHFNTLQLPDPPARILRTEKTSLSNWDFVMEAGACIRREHFLQSCEYSAVMACQGIFKRNSFLPKEDAINLTKHDGKSKRLFRNVDRCIKELRGLRRYTSLKSCDPVHDCHNKVTLNSRTERILAEFYSDYKSSKNEGDDERWIDWIHENLNKKSYDPRIGRLSLQVILSWSIFRITTITLTPIILSLTIGIWYMVETGDVSTAWTIGGYIVTIGAPLLAIATTLEKT
ncbi:hypothetical protein K432DRAFT_394937 [Lepidopterella palustris CBS 459.81]|uniref:Uncharacterized protein n=1 Tax=Lepidopterella palustris CBS 459.81 TaxID=1314670 RepID=A0A8E2E6G0_9PEZI|nr:hypothetical protein K432DRAFT_394937 [Lepidopterella palustris CBS 459.81]